MKWVLVQVLGVDEKEGGSFLLALSCLLGEGEVSWRNKISR